MSENNLPPCGIYKTRNAIGDVPKGRLVYFHNHGNPGPGLYPPSKWVQNKAFFAEKGMTLENAEEIVDDLIALPLEGFYITTSRLDFGEGNFIDSGVLIQMGYNGEAQPILFLPTWNETGITLPERGRIVEPALLANMQFVRVRREMSTEDVTVH